jgi:uncharacterized protein (TIGR02996 family)
MTAPELLSLIQGCKDAPDDDVPRLILADWLEENGDADRAEFVRLSVRLAAGDVSLGDEAVVIARLHKLYSPNAERWLGGLRRWTGRLTFERGLLQARCHAQGLNEVGGLATPDAAAWVEGLALAADGQQTGNLLAYGAIRPFSGLELQGGPLTAAHLKRIGGDPRAAGLRRLRVGLSGNQLALGSALSSCGALAGLRSLEFDTSLDGEALMGLAGAHWVRGLTALTLRCSASIHKGAPLLARSRHAPRLRRVNLTFGATSAAGLGQLVTSDVFADLEELRLERSGLRADGVQTLARRPEWPRLRRLHLANNFLDDAALAALAWLRLPALRRLDLSSNRLSATGLRELTAAPWCPGLEWLDLSGNDLGDEGARVLAGAASLANLHRLTLRWCRMSNEAARALAESPHLTRLHTLELDCIRGPSGVGALAAAGGLPALTALTMHLRGGTTEDVERFGTSDLAERLRYLELSMNGSWGGDPFAALASSRLTNLRDLRLHNLTCTEQGAAALARGPFAGLVRLEVESAAGALPALLATHGFEALAVLGLGVLHSAAAEALRSWPGSDRLAWLKLRWPEGLDERLRRLTRPVAFAV